MPCVSNIPLPSRDVSWLDEDSSLSSDTSDSDTESLVSDQSVDHLTTGFVAGNYDDNQEEMDNDDDNNWEASDGYDDSSSDVQEPDLLGAEATMFIEGPLHGLDLSAEEQLQSLQCGKNKASKFSLMLYCIFYDFTGEGCFESVVPFYLMLTGYHTI